MINLTERKIKYYKIAVIALSAVVFACSITQVAFTVIPSEGSGEVTALSACLFGWMAALGSGFCWLANPLLCYSWIALFENQRRSEWTGVSAVLLALSFLCLKKVVAGQSGLPKEIVSYGTGYWLWLSSLVVNCIGIFTARIITNRAYQIR